MKALTFVEIDVPAFASEHEAGFLGGVYLTRGAGLTGAADSKRLTFACWVYLLSGLGGRLITSVTALGGNTPGTRCVLSATENRFSIAGMSAAGTQICGCESSIIPFGRWVHLMASVDLADPAKRHIYVNGQEDLKNVSVYIDDVMDFTMADWGIGAYPNGTNLLNGAIADLWFQPGLYLDLSQAENRAKFLSAEGTPVDLGVDGAGPIGAPPLVFLSGALSVWHTNKGTGGGFSRTGNLAAFEALPTTYRFAQPTEYLPRDIEAIPSIASVAFTPATISLGEDLGHRASLTVSFTDHPHIFNGEPFNSGSFWGKWRARYGTRLRGRKLRWITGLAGQTLAEMEVRHFVVESTSGPTPGGVYTITAQDVLKLADGDRAQAPRLSNGALVGTLSNSATTATLTPAGIGNAEYPASGHVAIGGEEICAFTRSGDTLTLTRGQLGTSAAAHEAGDRVQLCLRYVGVDPAVIIADLLTSYAGVPSAYIPLEAWQTETQSFLQRVYSATIAEPTDVKDLVSELVEQAALAIWWEPSTQQIRLQVLRAIATDAQRFTEENTLEGSLAIEEQPNARISQVWTYFGQRNPLQPIDEENNFRSAVVTIDAESEFAYGGAAIKKIFSRWIPFGGRNVAVRLSQIILGRFRDAPRRFSFELFRYGTGVTLGGGYRLAAWPIQDITGAPTDAPIQVIRLNPMADRYRLEAEEMLMRAPDPEDLVNRVIIIDADAENLNMRELHDQLYPEPTGTENPAINVTCIIETGVVIGSNSVASPAFNVGSWPAGIPLTLRVRGRIQGRGGDGGGSGAGQAGGTALFARSQINLDDASGRIYGGGGGGGRGRQVAEFIGLDARAGGGGGAGRLPGAGGVATGGSHRATGNPGSLDAGGTGGLANSTSGGTGGAPGQAGSTGEGGSASGGGAAGLAIDGISFITTTSGPGDRRGGQVN